MIVVSDPTVFSFCYDEEEKNRNYPLLRNGATEATEALSVVPVVAILMTLGACILTEFSLRLPFPKALHYIPNHGKGNPVKILRMHALILWDHVHCIFL